MNTNYDQDSVNLLYSQMQKAEGNYNPSGTCTDKTTFLTHGGKSYGCKFEDLINKLNTEYDKMINTTNTRELKKLKNVVTHLSQFDTPEEEKKG